MNQRYQTNSQAPSAFSESLSHLEFPGWSQVIVPDLWQQQAITALKEGKDVVVQAPTGSGKTFIFEHWSKLGKNSAQAIYTVPTRALANDKLAEWRARGWNVGIATGDLSENLDAPIIVATLETQKLRLIRGEGPTLMVVDEYQMIRDPDRGLNYELAMALAPPHTQLLLLSGSVANPQDIVKWFNQLGRRAELVKTTHRPVPLEEVMIENLQYNVPTKIRGFWPRLVAKALAEDLGPILIFAPRRADSEKLAADLARHLPNSNPLYLTTEQRRCVGNNLAQMLKTRIVYHHSGLSYAARAGVIEPLTKAGQLRVVIATMGLAAGINFSLRTVALAADSYRRGGIEYAIQPDEILQMFGRAGRRGIDPTGYVLTSENGVRLHEGYSCHLSRSKSIDWSALLSVMHAAVDTGKEPFREAMRVQSRLFTANRVPLGIEESHQYPDVPCQLQTDTERARLARKQVKQILNSRGVWQRSNPPQERPVKEVFATLASPNNNGNGDWSPALTEEGKPILIPALKHRPALEKIGIGILTEYTPSRNHAAETPQDSGETVNNNHADGEPIFARTLTLADVYNGEKIYLSKYVRRLINWHGRQVQADEWETKALPRILTVFEQQKMKCIKVERLSEKITALLDLSELTLSAVVDQDRGVYSHLRHMP